jgi:hypothetical protein
MGPICPGWWQIWQFCCTIRDTWFENVISSALSACAEATEGRGDDAGGEDDRPSPRRRPDGWQDASCHRLSLFPGLLRIERTVLSGPIGPNDPQEAKCRATVVARTGESPESYVGRFPTGVRAARAAA